MYCELIWNKKQYDTQLVTNNLKLQLNSTVIAASIYKLSLSQLNSTKSMFKITLGKKYAMQSQNLG